MANTATATPKPAIPESRQARKRQRMEARKNRPTPEQRAQQKEDRRKRQTPQPEKYEVELASGQHAKVVFKFGKDTVDRKVHVVMGIPVIWYTGSKKGPGMYISTERYFDERTQRYQRAPTPRLLKDKKGNPVLIPVEVPACFVEITMPGGKKLKARSCCKPPDIWERWQARREALANLFAEDKKFENIAYGDRRRLMEACVPQLFNRGSKKKAKAQPVTPGTVMIADEKGVLRLAPASLQEAAKTMDPDKQDTVPTTAVSPKAAKTTAKA